MGYFSSGTEGLGYQESYCFNCENWTRREDEDSIGCPIWDFHLIDNYGLCNVKDNYLDKLIPRAESRLSNKKCVMFLPTQTNKKCGGMG